MFKLRTGLAIGALGLSLGGAAGCLVTNLNHCHFDAGACGEGMVCSNCAVENNGCVPQGTPLDDACLVLGSTSNPATTTSQTTTSMPTTVEPTETSVDPSGTTFEPMTDPGTETTNKTSTDTTDATSSTTSEGPCTGEGNDSVGCGGDTPYCVAGECVGCDEIDCAVVVPGKPTCVANLGLCVECQAHEDCATAEKPACNSETATCEACSSHEHCPATACNLETGECFPQGNVLYVDYSTGCSDAPPDYGLTPEEPLCSLKNAMVRLSVGVPTTIKVKAGDSVQNQSAVMKEGNYIAAIVHYAGNVPSLVTVVDDFPALTVREGNTVFMSRLSINNLMPKSDPLVSCEGGAKGARVWFERQRIFGGKTAIRAENCQVHVHRSTITSNTIGAIEVTGTSTELAHLWLENTYITDNTGSQFGAIRASADVNVDVLYSTIALNNSPLAPIECDNGWSGEMKIRNSALVNKDLVIGGGCNAPPLAYTFVKLEGDKGALMAEVFSGFADGVFQAKIGGALAGFAKWIEGDPVVDQDTTPRPTSQDSMDYAGADARPR